MSNDEEYGRMMLEAEEKTDAKKWAPPMSTWSTEAGMLAEVIDALHGIRHTLIAVNSKNRPEPPVPYTRPRTVMTRLKHEARQAAHEALVARVLPHKRK